MKKGGGRMKKNRTSNLSRYRIINIHRPQLPQILKFIDREFEVIYINLDAAPDAKIVWMQ